jgi:hypothetical protein
LDFDGASVHFAHVDTSWLKSYAELVLRVVREVAPVTLGSRNVLQVVITTTVTEPLGEFQPVDADIYACPHCPASEVVPRSANAQVFICRECNASWTRDDADNGDSDDDQEAECARAEDDVRFVFRSASRRATQQLLPIHRQTRRVGAHFRVQGILVTPADAIEFVRLVRQRSYAFDRSIPVSAWDDALDEGPVARRQLRLTLTHKAAKCATCKGRRGDGHAECFACFGRGYEVLQNKTYHVLDVLCDAPCDAVAQMTGVPCDDAGPHPKFLTEVGGAACDRVRTDCAFVLFLCSISVPIQGATETDFDFGGGAPPHAPLSDSGSEGRKRRFSETSCVAAPVPNACAAALDKKRLRGTKNFLPPEKFALLLAAVVEVCPTYAPASVRQAFFTDKTHRVIVAHLDGPTSTFCLNKAKTSGSHRGFHQSSRAWATITQAGNGVCFLRLRCFSKKRATHPETGEECGCGSWKGEVFTLGHALAAQIFGEDQTPAASSGGGGSGRGVDGDRACIAQESMYPFLKGFRRNGSLVKFLRDVDSSANTGNVCAFLDKLPQDPISNVMKFLDHAGVRVCTAPQPSQGSSVINVIRRAHAARTKRALNEWNF